MGSKFQTRIWRPVMLPALHRTTGRRNSEGGAPRMRGHSTRRGAARTGSNTCQCGVHLDAELTMSNKRRHVSIEPSPPGRAIYKDLCRLTFVNSQKNFNFHEEVNGDLLLVPKMDRLPVVRIRTPQRSFCDHAEKTVSFRHHCGQHWKTRSTDCNTGVQQITIANSGQSSLKMEAMEKRLKDLEQRQARSHSLRGPRMLRAFRTSSVTAPPQYLALAGARVKDARRTARAGTPEVTARKVPPAATVTSGRIGVIYCEAGCCGQEPVS